MLEEKKIKESESRAKQYIQEGIVKSKEKKEHVKFFLDNADNSLATAKTLYELSTSAEKQKNIGLTSFNGFLWVVNAGYYSMFYMARALLENAGIKIKTDRSLHAITFDAVIHYFYLTGKLQKAVIEDLIEARQEASELLGKQKADELIEDYFHEKTKRATFTYETGETVMQNKAKTSLKRAIRFNEEIKKLTNQ